mmetsp:Transcript_9130/g.28302  ORF Transcript_9130/g.28302 Transcript_9130/m.28302 type:complete len:209 (-) Transcript_9130:1261-1887(-)
MVGGAMTVRFALPSTRTNSARNVRSMRARPPGCPRYRHGPTMGVARAPTMTSCGLYRCPARATSTVKRTPVRSPAHCRSVDEYVPVPTLARGMPVTFTQSLAYAARELAVKPRRSMAYVPSVPEAPRGASASRTNASVPVAIHRSLSSASERLTAHEVSVLCMKRTEACWRLEHSPPAGSVRPPSRAATAVFDPCCTARPARSGVPAM